MLLREFLPSRSAEDILAERVRLHLGGEVHTLPVLTIAETEAWQERFASELGVVLAQVQEADSPAAVMARLVGLVDLQLRLMRGFDKTSVLPDDDAIKAKASPSALLKAFIEVLAAAHPTVGVLLDAVVRNPEMIRELIQAGTAMPSPPATNGSRPSTAGARGRSAKK